MLLHILISTTLKYRFISNLYFGSIPAIAKLEISTMYNIGMEILSVLAPLWNSWNILVDSNLGTYGVRKQSEG
jgi:hypothetical protein